MSFKIKRWALIDTINVVDYDANAGGGDGSALRYAFAFAGRIVYLVYDAITSLPTWYTYSVSTQAWTGPHAGPATQNAWGFYSPTYGDSAEYRVWGKKYLLGTALGTNTDTFVTIDEGFNLAEWFPPAAPSGAGIDHVRTYYHPGVGTDEFGEPARLMTYEYWTPAFLTGTRMALIYRYGPGGAKVIYHGEKNALAWPEDVEHQTIYNSKPAGPFIFWYVRDSSCDARVEARWSLYGVPPLVGTECSPLAYIAPSSTFRFYDGVVWDLVQDLADYLETGVGVMRWVPISEDPLSAAAVPWSGVWDIRRNRDGLNYAIDQGDVDGVEHGVYMPIDGEPSYDAGSDWYVGLSVSGKGSTVRDVYVLDPRQPVGMSPRAPKGGSTAIGWIGECAIRPNLRVEDVLPADRVAPQGLAGEVVERVDGKTLMTNTAIVKRTGGVLANNPALLSVDVSSYPVTDPDWVWPGSEDGCVEQMGWASFAEGPDGTMLWGGMPDPMMGMYLVTGSVWVPRWMGLGVLQNENLDAAPGLATHTLQAYVSEVPATFSTMQPMPANYESAPDQLTGFPDFPGGPIVVFSQNCTRQNEMPFWQAVVWRVTEGVWTELVDFSAVGPPGLGETGWTVWSVAPIYACKELPDGGFLLGATLYFDPWDPADWETTPGARTATFMDTGKGYVPSIKGYRGPLQIDLEPQLLVCEPLSGGRSLYGPDALLVYDHQGNFLTHLNTDEVYPPDGRQILVTRERSPRVIFKIYKEGLYSDFAEGWGAYHRFDEDAETSVPLYVCYDLFSSAAGYGTIAPGMGRCHGFLDMHALGAERDANWRWQRPNTLYGEYAAFHPREEWAVPARLKLRLGIGGRIITLLGSRNPGSRQGTKGVGQRA